MTKYILALILLLVPSFSFAQQGSTSPSFGRDKCLWVENSDASVKNIICGKMILESGTLTDNGNGSFSYTVAGGGGGGSTVTLQYNDVTQMTGTFNLDISSTHFEDDENPTDEWNLAIKDIYAFNTGDTLSGDYTLLGTTTGTFSGPLTGNSSTATALAANGGNCSSGEYPLGVDASGAVESCTDATTEIDSAISTHASDGDAHHAESHTVASHSDTTATGAELETLTDGSDADSLHAHSGASLNDDIFVLNTSDTMSGNLDISGTLGVLNIDFDGEASPSHTPGLLTYSTDDESLEFHNSESEIKLQVGQEFWVRVRNESGSTITNGQAVYVNGNHAGTGLPTIDLARSDALSTSENFLGLATHDIENNTVGYVTSQGRVGGLNTSSFSNGDMLWVDSSTAGALTATRPSQPNFTVAVGGVTKSNASNGTIHVMGGDIKFGAYTANYIAFGGSDGFIKEDSALQFNSTTDIMSITGSLTVTQTITGTLAGNLADGLIVEPDLDADNSASDGDMLTYDSTGTNFAWITPNAGTDVTADLEEEAHESEHRENGADELLGENLGTACSENEILKANATGGFDCGTDNSGGAGGGGSLWTFNSSDDLVYIATLSTDAIVGGSTQAGADIWLNSDGSAVFNEQSNDSDFRVESNNFTHMVFVDAGTDMVGIGTANPFTTLSVEGSIIASQTITGTFVGDLTGNVTGNADTATALAANGANCSAGEYPLGVDASGATESCTDATTEIDSAISTHASDGDAHHAESHTIASHSDTTATGAELETLTDGSDADSLHVHSGASLNDDLFVLIAGDTMTGNLDVGGTLKVGGSGDDSVILPASSISDAEVSDTLTSSIFIGSGSTTNNIDTGEITDDTVGFVDMAHTITLAGNPALAVSQCHPGANGIICEGTVADSFEALLSIPVATSDKTITFQNATHTVVGRTTTDTLTNKTITDSTNAISATRLTSGTVPVARVGADHIDAITEIASAIRDSSGLCAAGSICTGGHEHAGANLTDDIFVLNAGDVMTGELTADDLGIEFTAGDTLTDCSTFAATGGGIFYDDSEGKFKKCQDNTLTDLDTTGGGGGGSGLWTYSGDPNGLVYIGTVGADVAIGATTLSTQSKLEVTGSVKITGTLDVDGAGTFGGTDGVPSEFQHLEISGTVGIGTTRALTSVIVELSSTTKALLLTRIPDPSTGITEPKNGMIVYDSGSDEIQGRVAGAWVNLGAGGAEVNNLETIATGIADGEIPVGDGADSLVYVAGLSACAADEKIEYTPGSPDTFGCEAIGSLVDADMLNDALDADKIVGDSTDDDDLDVAAGGTGVSTLTDGGVLLGSGASDITAMAVLADGEMIVGDGTTDPVAESGATLRTSIGVGTGDSPTFTGLTTSGATNFQDAEVEVPNSAADKALATAGEMHLNTTDEQLSFHSAADGEISGEAALSLIKKVVLTFDPAGWYDQESVFRVVPVMEIGDEAPEGIQITEWSFRYVGGDPTTEFTGDLICDTTPDYDRSAGATVMDAIDTTAGASSADTGFDSATCANGAYIYIDMDADPTDANVLTTLNLDYYYEED